jgi:hypothetical protein
MTNQNPANSINNLSAKNGLLIGLIVVVLNVVYYFIDPLLTFTNMWVGVFSLVLIIALLVILGIDVRKKIGGFWSFGQAFKSLIIMTVIIVLFSTVYNFILFKFVDTQLPAKATAALLEKTTATLNNLGMDQSKIDEATKTFTNGEVEAKMQPTIKNEALGFLYGVILYGIISLIIAAIIKKKTPLIPVAYDEPQV